MCSRVFERAALEGSGSEKHPLVCADCADAVGKNLHYLSLHRSPLVFTLHENQEVCSERLESNCDINLILAVRRSNSLSLFSDERPERSTTAFEYGLDLALELFRCQTHW